MRLYSCHSSNIDDFKEECVKILALNSARCISTKDLEKFISKLSDLYHSFHAFDLSDYFAKK